MLASGKPKVLTYSTSSVTISVTAFSGPAVDGYGTIYVANSTNIYSVNPVNGVCTTLTTLASVGLPASIDSILAADDGSLVFRDPVSKSFYGLRGRYSSTTAKTLFSLSNIIEVPCMNRSGTIIYAVDTTANQVTAYTAFPQSNSGTTGCTQTQIFETTYGYQSVRILCCDDLGNLWGMSINSGAAAWSFPAANNYATPVQLTATSIGGASGLVVDADNTPIVLRAGAGASSNTICKFSGSVGAQTLTPLPGTGVLSTETSCTLACNRTSRTLYVLCYINRELYTITPNY